MRKKIINIICLMILVVSCILVLPACKLLGTSGLCKHTLTTFGICNTCSTDTTIELVYNTDNTYTTSSHPVNSNFEYFYKFTGHGESGFNLTLNSSDINVATDIRLYSSTEDEDEYERVNRDYNTPNTVYKYEGTLNTDQTYYLQITYRRAGYDANVYIGDLIITLTPLTA